MAKPKTGGPGSDQALPRDSHRREMAALKRRLEEAEESLNAIRSGEVDALVIKGPFGDQVYTLKDADRPYRMIIENMGEGTVTIRPDGFIIYANRQFAAMLDVSLEKLLGDNLFSRAAPSALEDLERLVAKAQKASVHADVEFVKASGGPLLAHLSLAPMSIEGIRALSGIIADMTEQKQTQEELTRLAAVVSQAVDGVMILNPAGEIVYANPACQTITGYADSELVGTGQELFGAETVADVRRVLANEGVWKAHVGRIRKDGKPIDLDVSVVPLRTQSGAISSYIIFFRDITHALKLEQTIRQMERTEALGRLAGGVAHDLNNILLPIVVNAELLLDEERPDSPRQAMLKNILQAAYRQRDLVKKILSFTRQTKQNLQAIRIQPVVAEALKLIKPSLPASIEMRYVADKPKDTVSGDPTEIHELVTNLCANAVDAMAERGGVLEVSLATVDLDAKDFLLDVRPGPYVRLTVKDTGCGIPPQNLDRIFDPFFTTKEAGKGTGIGLSVVRGIVKSHGGAITVESSVSRGTDVSVYLPTADEVAPPGDRRARDRGPAVQSSRILLVDDEDMVLDTMRRALESFGHKPTAVKNAAGALALFRTWPQNFDLAVVDQTMPQMSGLELAAKLRKISPGLPIILTTGYSKSVDEDSLRAAGVSEVVMKPLTLRDLAAAVNRAVALPGKK